MNEAGVVEAMNEATRQRRQLLSRSNASELRRILLQTNYIAHGSVMMQKSVCEAVGNYREELFLAEDYDLWLRMAERSALGMLPEALYVYRVHSDSVSKRNWHSQLKMLRIVRELAAERWRTGTDILQQGGAAAFFARYGAELQEAGQADAARESSQLALEPS
jgi:GT2 family glycosyltransferase